MSTRVWLLGAFVAGMLAVTASAAGAGAATTGAGAATTAQLLASADAKTVVVDPRTGAVLSVVPVSPGSELPGFGLAPAISSSTDCAAGDGCYYTPNVTGTYHDRSFYGTAGTFTGYWPRRDAWDSGRYSAYACWQGACSQWVGPNTYVTFGGALVTGTSFTIN